MTTPPDDLVGSARERHRRTDQVGDPRHRRHRGERVPAGAERDGRGCRAERGEPRPRARPGLGGGAGRHARGRGLRRGDRRSRGRGRLHPAAERHARGVDDRRPRGRQGRASARSRCAAPSRRPSMSWPRARATGVPLWEAFVFPFHEQMARVRAMLADGDDRQGARDPVAVPLRAGRPDNIRLFANLPAARSRTSAATRSGWRACCSTPSPTSHAPSPTPNGPRTAPTRSCGARWRSLATADWCSRAGSGAEYDTFTRVLGTGGDPA